MIKLIATDMDGTLVNSKKELPSDIFSIINKLYNKDIQFVVASGRQYYNLLTLFKSVKDKVIFIAENGGLVYKNGENIYIDVMSPDNLIEILKEVKKVPHLHPILCGLKAAYYVADSDVFVKNAHLYFEKYVYVDDILKAVTLDKICKIAIYDTSNAETNCYANLKHLDNKYKVTLSDNHWVDICNPATNKGRALKIIQNDLNISYDETMAFGDYMNDAEMMKVCQHSYAMANAHPDLKKICNYEAPSNDDNGVIKIICKTIQL